MESVLLSGLVRLLALAMGISLAGLMWSVAGAESREVLILQIRVLRGEGLVNTVGSKSANPLLVQVSDETGRPVAGATVSFRLPEDGPGGFFRSGLHTDVAVTGADGKAAMGTVLWGRTPGPVHIRVVAAKDRTRSGIVVSQYLAEQPARAAAAAR